jgi:4-pyridoxate dehydrogenase
MRADRVARAMIVGYLLGTGPATMVPGVCAFVRSEASLSRPDIELIFRGSSLKPHIWFPGIRRPFEDAFAVRPVLPRPKSRGEVLLRSANPFDPPRIRLDFLSDPDDLGRLVGAARISFELIESAPFDAFRGRPLEPVSRSTDQDIADWALACRRSVPGA